MNWVFQLHHTQPVAHAVGVLALVCMAGMALGSVKIRGVGLGTAGVLFAGIITGHFGQPFADIQGLLGTIQCFRDITCIG